MVIYPTIYLDVRHQTVWELWHMRLSDFGYRVIGSAFEREALDKQLLHAVVALVDSDEQEMKVRKLCPELLIIRLLDDDGRTVNLPVGLSNNPQLAFYLHIFLQHNWKNKKTRINR
ncbi:MAG: hypothetical protein ACKKL5_01520 [Candidatus Komeilibacteria bacterium]